MNPRRIRAIMDTGPIVAYWDEQEAHHEWATETFDQLGLGVVTCEPVLTEACFLLGRTRRPPAQVLDFFRVCEMRIGLRIDEELSALQALIQRYANVPMSLADACLVRLAETTGLPICTLDRDFAIYRAHGRRALALIAPPPLYLQEDAAPPPTD